MEHCQAKAGHAIAAPVNPIEELAGGISDQLGLAISRSTQC